jgi:cytochrome c heme-lyase
MSKVVAIHNTVNERAWEHILAWEALHACDCANPRLKRFQGKPNEFSPKARLLNFLVGGVGCGGGVGGWGLAGAAS